MTAIQLEMGSLDSLFSDVPYGFSLMNFIIFLLAALSCKAYVVCSVVLINFFSYWLSTFGS